MKTLVPTLAMLLALTLAACGGDSPAGTYVLVKDDALKAAVTASMPKDLPKEAAEAMAKMVDSMSMSLTLKPDKTFEGESMTGMRFTTSGTWELSGSELTLTTTTMNGKKKDPPDTLKLVYEGKQIRVPKGTEHVPADLVLRRE